MADNELPKFTKKPSLYGIPNYWRRFGATFDEMRKKSILVDIRLICNGRQFDAHRVFLEAASEYFHDIFAIKMTEKTHPKIHLPNWTPTGVEVVLDILYTGKFRHVEFLDLRGVLTALYLINLKEAFCYYRNLFLKHLSVSNFLLFWLIGENLNDNQILQAVYNLAPTVYKSNDFKVISVMRLKRLLQYLDMTETISEDLKLRIITEWTLFKDTRLSGFSDLITGIDFSKLSDDQLIDVYKESLIVAMSGALKKKILSIFLHRFVFMMALQKIETLSHHVFNIFLIGTNDCDELYLQNCKMGQWKSDFSLEKYNHPVDADILDCRNNLKIITKNKAGEIMMYILGCNGEMMHDVTLEDIPAKGNMLVSQTNHCTAIIGYIPSHLSATFIGDFQNSDMLLIQKLQMHYTDLKEGRLYLLCNERHLFILAIVESVFHDIIVSLHELNEIDYEWKELIDLSIGNGSLSTPCFSQMTASHIVVRFFPGKSYYFRLFDLKCEEREENNDVPGIVSFIIHGNSAWCLDDAGQIYVQDLFYTKSPWQLIARAPTPLSNYRKLAIGRGII